MYKSISFRFLNLFVLNCFVIALAFSGCNSKDNENNSVSYALEEKQSGDQNKTLIRIGSISTDIFDEIRTLQPLIEYLNKQHELDEYHFKAIAAVNVKTMLKLIKEKKIEIYIDSPFPIVKIMKNVKLNILLRRWKKGVKEYNSVIFVKNESAVSSLADLQGKFIAFEDPYSTSSYALPKAGIIQSGYSLNSQENLKNIPQENTINYVFSEDDDNTFLWVLKDKVTAGATNNIAFENLPSTHRDKFRIIYQTESVPRHIVCSRSGLDPEFICLFSSTLVNMAKNKAGKETLKKYEKTSCFDQLPDEISMIKKINKFITTLSN